MRKPNYSAEKRKRQLAKQAKRDAKLQRKRSQQQTSEPSAASEGPEQPLDDRDDPTPTQD